MLVRKFSKCRQNLNGTEIEESDDLDEEPAIVRESIEVKVPERFSKELKLDPFADTIFGKGYEEAYKANMFKNAAAKYITHSEMVKNGYLMGHEPKISLIA